MTKTHRTKGKSISSKLPKGNCDMCNTTRATHWFGQTSVALCDNERCAERNAAKWNALLEEINEADSDSF